MNHPHLPPTSVGLLHRLRSVPFDEEAWSQFADCYNRHVYTWCRRCGLTASDAEEVTQNVQLQLLEKLQDFRYNPDRRFRGWLRIVVKNACVAFLRSPKTRRLTCLATNALECVAAHEDLSAYLEQMFDLELYEEALRQVEAKVAPTTWQAFALSEFHGVSNAEIATRLSIPPSHVPVYQNRVRLHLRTVIANLEHTQR